MENNNYGTLSVIDSLRTYNNTTVLAFGEEQMNGYVDIMLAAQNAVMADMTADLVGVVPAAEWTYGTNTDTGEMDDLDEYALADAQKIPFAPSSVGFPLRRTGRTIQWTRDYLATTSPLEMAYQVKGIIEADDRTAFTRQRRALLRATNNTGYVDRLVNNRTFTVRALANADGQGIPPNALTGATFDPATHTHYLATATFVEANLVSLIETVREHGLFGGSLRVYINANQEAAVRAFSGFNAYVDPRIIYATSANRAAGTVNVEQTEDRAIGFHGPAEIWVKHWWPANYVLAFRYGGVGDPVLGWRRPEGALAPFGDLRIVADLDRHPLHARSYERIYGVAAWNRVRAAVLFTGGGTYVSYAG